MCIIESMWARMLDIICIPCMPPIPMPPLSMWPIFMPPESMCPILMAPESAWPIVPPAAFDSSRLPRPPQPARASAETISAQCDIPISMLLYGVRLRSPKYGIFGSFEPAPPPDEVDRRDHHEGEQGRGDHPAHHRCRDPLHHLRAGAVAPEGRQEAQHDRRHRHELGSQPVHGAVLDGSHELGAVGATPTAGEVGPRVVEVEQHDDPGLSSDAGERKIGRA